jgi:protein gp37
MMSDKSKIEWTDATWNVITGCSVVSAGCKNCYAMKLAGTRLRNHPSRTGLTKDSAAGPVWTGEVRFNDKWLIQPVQWKRPRRVFVCAHGDLFHESVPDAWIDNVFAVMAIANQHTFQILTKRPGRMLDYLNSPKRGLRIQNVVDDMESWDEELIPRDQCAPLIKTWPLPNVWLGVSVENQATADERIPLLLQTPAAKRFVSIEPMLGKVYLHYSVCPKCLKHHSHSTWGAGTVCLSCGKYHGINIKEYIHWVIVGGEIGQNARPMHPEWARSIRDQCKAAGVPFLFKQWGEWIPGENTNTDVLWQNGYRGLAFPKNPERNYVMWEPNGAAHFGKRKSFLDFEVDCFAERIGKKHSGRLLDGVLHDEYPTTTTQKER